MLRQRIKDVSPEQILKRGYSITLLDGKVVTNPSQVQPDDIITTRLAEGEISSTVKS